MKILIAPDSFKGSLSAKRAAESIRKGFSEILPNAHYFLFPLADGGEGTVSAIINATGGSFIEEKVTSPSGKKIPAKYGVLKNGKTAIIEMAAASGLELLSAQKKNPFTATTFGTGELIKSALDKGFPKIIVGLGGSATIDCGTGMAQALGAKLLDGKGKQIPFGLNGLQKLEKIDISQLDKRIFQSEIIAAYDVRNPLTGKSGAAFVYGKQKGAKVSELPLIDDLLKKFAFLVKRDLGTDVTNLVGAGAAGGLGAGLFAFLNAKLKPGFQVVSEIINLEKVISTVDLVITGEGELSLQSCFGKAPVEIAKLAKKYAVPIICICGKISEENCASRYFNAVFSIKSKKITEEEAMKNAEYYLKKISKKAAKEIKNGKFKFVIANKFK